MAQLRTPPTTIPSLQLRKSQHDRGYDEESIRKVLGGNLLRVMAEAEATADGN